MMRLMTIAATLFLGAGWLGADDKAVQVGVPRETAWVGERVPFTIELRAPGTFSGSSSFDLPQIPGVLILKVGSPLVGSMELDGQSWFTQTHEFALFSQRSGTIEVPPFRVRFANRNGFTGPVRQCSETVPAISLSIKRPEGSETIGFLVTTEVLKITQSWDPEPVDAQVGDMFKRTINQQAGNLSGIALAPVPQTESAGYRIYADDASVNDQFERGAFLGQRSETVTYLLTQPGLQTLPDLVYTWFNPATQSLQQTTLPGASLLVAAAPAQPQAANGRSSLFAVAAFLAIIIALALWQRRRILYWLKHYIRRLNPPERVAARKLLRACKRNDPVAAAGAWFQWRATRDPAWRPASEMQSAVIELQRHLYGRTDGEPWNGRGLARAFNRNASAIRTSPAYRPDSILPLLNGR